MPRAAKLLVLAVVVGLLAAGAYAWRDLGCFPPMDEGDVPQFQACRDGARTVGRLALAVLTACALLAVACVVDLLRRRPR